MGARRRRLDTELVRRGLAGSRTEAQEAIVAGLVTVDGAPAHKSSTQVHAGEAVAVAAPARRYVSRGGDKLAHGLDRFGITVDARRCLDVGASTGGFSDCLLQRGAAHVVACDVGYGQLHWSLRRDPRVTVLERTNIRSLAPDALPVPAPDLLVCDVSFVGLTRVLPALPALGAATAEVVVLVKPQFEAGRGEVGKGGVVTDPDVWRDVLRRVSAAADACGSPGFDATSSPLVGPAGNVEFLAHLSAEVPRRPVEAVIDAAIAEGRVVGGRGEAADAGRASR